MTTLTNVLVVGRRRFGSVRGHRMAAIERLLVLSTVALGSVACAGDSTAKDPPTTTEPATSQTSSTRISIEQASRLADVLVKNREAGTAHVTATYDGPEGKVSFDGSVDWPSNVGLFDLAFDDASAELAPDSVAYSGSSLFQHLPELADELAARGYPGAEWTVQQIVAGSSPLVRVLSLISGASAEQRDNPTQLVARGVTVMGRETIDGEPCEGYAMDKSTYWVGLEDAMLHRIDAKLGSASVTIQLSEWGAASVELPESDRLVDAAVVTEILGAARPSQVTTGQ